jgi:hypothetical protein
MTSPVDGGSPAVTLGGAVVAVPGSDVHDVLLLWPFQASANTVKDTTDRAAQHQQQGDPTSPSPKQQ